MAETKKRERRGAPVFCMIFEIYLIVSTSKTSSHSFSA